MKNMRDIEEIYSEVRCLSEIYAYLLKIADALILTFLR